MNISKIMTKLNRANNRRHKIVSVTPTVDDKVHRVQERHNRLVKERKSMNVNKLVDKLESFD